MMDFSVIMPVFNLAETVRGNVECVAEILARTGLRCEIVVVDDGSSDATPAEISRLAGRPASGVDVRPVFVKRNAGKGNALREGFAASAGERVMLLDGDLDILPKQIPVFLETMNREKADVVIGSKRHPESNVQYPWHRRVTSAVYFALVKTFIGMPVTDTQTGMKLFRRKVLGDALARMLVKTFAFDLELLAIAYGRGAKIVEAPVEIRFGEKFGCLKARTVRQMAWDSLSVFYRLRLLNYYAKVEVPPPLKTKPLVTVVIACPNDSWMLQECLGGLVRQTYDRWEAIVLPDGECKGGSDERVRWVPTGKVRPAEKRNTGIREAKGEIVAFIDDDAYPDEHWLENAVKYFSEPSIGGLGGPGVTPPGDGFWAKCGGRVYENVFVSGNYRYRYLGGRVRKDIDDYPSCNLFVRKEILERIGGYRTDFWPGEDTLLCEAIVLGEHKRIVYDPWTLVYHHRRRLFAPHLRQLGRYGFHRGYFVKRFPATSARFSYFVPSLFVAYLIVLTGLWIWRGFSDGGPLGPIAAVASAPFFLYVVCTVFSTFSFNPASWLATALGVWTSHVWYGVQFVRGLFAAKAPCEFIGKDHA